ncbi:MAG: suppressor of fused domain protein [Actinomycetota bacterium]|nr:suppressor of fused domain protein [Actinomycetota bacterium]
MRQPAPEHVKAIYAQIKALFGGTKPIVDRFGDDHDDLNWVDVMRTPDSPQPGVTSYATLGMSRFDNGGLESGGKPLRVELVAACQSEFTHIADGLSSCALNVAKDGWQVTPGVVHPNALGLYRSDLVLKHLFLVTPYLWGDEPDDREFDELLVTWLMAVPVSDSEVEHVRTRGPESLEALFEERQIDIFDINREPVV